MNYMRIDFRWNWNDWGAKVVATTGGFVVARCVHCGVQNDASPIDANKATHRQYTNIKATMEASSWACASDVSHAREKLRRDWAIKQILTRTLHFDRCALARAANRAEAKRKRQLRWREGRRP